MSTGKQRWTPEENAEFWQDYTELIDGLAAVTDKTPVFPDLPDDPQALAQTIFWLHDRKRVTQRTRRVTKNSSGC